MRLPDPRPDYFAGVGASLIAEMVFIFIGSVVSLLRGMDPWMVARVPGSFVLGSEAVEPPGFELRDVLIGLLMHLWLGILVGVIYAGLLPRLGISPVAGGLVVGTVLYVLGFWVLPLLFPIWLSPFWLPPLSRAMQAGGHVVYGLIFGYAYQRLDRGRSASSILRQP